MSGVHYTQLVVRLVLCIILCIYIYIYIMYSQSIMDTTHSNRVETLTELIILVPPQLVRTSQLPNNSILASNIRNSYCCTLILGVLSMHNMHIAYGYNLLALVIPLGRSDTLLQLEQFAYYAYSREYNYYYSRSTLHTCSMDIVVCIILCIRMYAYYYSVLQQVVVAVVYHA